MIALDSLDPRWLDPRLGDVDAERLARCPAVIVNIEYPLGLAAYNILREITEAHDTLQGVYILGKAATLNADVGDVMISSVIHDEHSGSTYWLDNAFSVSDIAPFLMFGSGLDNQRAVTVKSTFLQNREYLDFYYREAFTVVEMEAGPYCNAVYEIADVDRYPVGEAVNFSKLPIDFGIIHYASDTPYTQARTLGARGLSYYGMDSTYASSLAILRRVLALEGVSRPEPRTAGPRPGMCCASSHGRLAALADPRHRVRRGGDRDARVLPGAVRRRRRGRRRRRAPPACRSSARWPCSSRLGRPAGRAAAARALAKRCRRRSAPAPPRWSARPRRCSSGSPTTKGVGCVRIDGEVWTARAYMEEETYEAGTRVQVVEIRGATALVTD